LKFVVSSNLNRRHLDEFQKAHVAIKYDNLYRKISLDQYRRHSSNQIQHQRLYPKDIRKNKKNLLVVCGQHPGMLTVELPEESSDEIDQEGKIEEDLVRPGSAAQLAQQFGISQPTMERVRTIMVEEEVDDEPL
jgi:hypothetical protein